MIRQFQRLLLLACLVTNQSLADQSGANGAPMPDASVSALSVNGFASQPGDDDPRVLYILPWQAPTIPRRPRAELETVAPEIMESVDPVVFERHRQFRETLNPDMDSPFTLN